MCSEFSSPGVVTCHFSKLIKTFHDSEVLKQSPHFNVSYSAFPWRPAGICLGPLHGAEPFHVTLHTNKIGRAGQKEKTPHRKQYGFYKINHQFNDIHEKSRVSAMMLTLASYIFVQPRDLRFLRAQIQGWMCCETETIT